MSLPAAGFYVAEWPPQAIAVSPELSPEFSVWKETTDILPPSKIFLMVNLVENIALDIFVPGSGPEWSFVWKQARSVSSGVTMAQGK